MRIELLTAADCPNVAAARDRLRQACQRAGVPAHWQEWDVDDPATPAERRGWPSPTILIDGRDVLDQERGAGPGCRLYRDVDGAIAPAPAVERIKAVLQCSGSGQGGRLSGFAAALPSLGLAALPNLACPACWPAYAGLLSTLGLGALLEARWLLPLTLAGLTLLVTVLAWRAPRRQGYGPAIVAAAAAIVLLLTKFAWPQPTVAGGASGALVVAAIWNAWPPQRARIRSDASGLRFNSNSPCCGTT